MTFQKGDRVYIKKVAGSGWVSSMNRYLHYTATILERTHNLEGEVYTMKEIPFWYSVKSLILDKDKANQDIYLQF